MHIYIHIHVYVCRNLEAPLQDPYWQFCLREMEGIEVTMENMEKVVKKLSKRFVKEQDFGS